jgi:hypothetical protein
MVLKSGGGGSKKRGRKPIDGVEVEFKCPNDLYDYAYRFSIETGQEGNISAAVRQIIAQHRELVGKNAGRKQQDIALRRRLQ